MEFSDGLVENRRGSRFTQSGIDGCTWKLSLLHTGIPCVTIGTKFEMSSLGMGL
jgi:hypothetical protein